MVYQSVLTRQTSLIQDIEIYEDLQDRPTTAACRVTCGMVQKGHRYAGDQEETGKGPRPL